MGGLGERLVSRVEEVGVAALPGATDTTAQLVQLRQTHTVGAIDEQGVGRGDVDTRLDDGGADQHVRAALPEVHHDLFELLLVHLAVGGDDSRLRHEFAQLGGRLLDGLHSVVDVEDLTLASQLATDGSDHLTLVVGAGESEDGVTFLRRRGDRAHFSDARHGHFQGARDRGGAHRQDVDVDPHALEGFLVFDAEALLLVDDDQSEVLELNLLGEQAVGTNHDVNRAALEAIQGLAGLGVGLESGQSRDLDREPGVTLGKRLEVLLHQKGGWHQHGHLFAVLNGLESGSHCDLGLAVTDVATDQTVHRDDLFHVVLDVGDGGELIRGLDVGEGVLQLPLPGGVGAESVAPGGLPGGIKLDEFSGDLTDCLACTRLALAPVGATHPVQTGSITTDIAGHLV